MKTSLKLRQIEINLTQEVEMKKASGLLGVKIVGGLHEICTPWSGASLLIDLNRKLELDQLANKILPAKKTSKGLKPGEMVESFILLSALGGECFEDMQHLRDDAGLASIAGYTLPSPETARQWLDGFHEEALMENRPLQGSFIPPESPALSGLKELDRRVIYSYIKNLNPGNEVTLDVDTQMIEVYKADAKVCYEGYKALQAMKVCWAETLLVMADECREGNVFPGKDIIRVVDEANGLLPPRMEGEWKIRVRSDSAAYDQDVLDDWNGRHWEFAVSADMTEALKKEIERLPNDAWHFWKTEKNGVRREWAEVPYVPARKTEKKDSQPYRYVAIRLRRQQGELFEDGNKVRHYAVVSNRWDMPGQALLEWQRGKAGTIEQVHAILTNDLAGGRFPSAKHGTNAAWLRLQVITYNLLQLLKKAALPQEYANAHPKRLRFAIFTMIGRIVSHSGRVLLRIANDVWATIIAPALKRIVLLDTG
jgi:hypothetical protein